MLLPQKWDLCTPLVHHRLESGERRLALLRGLFLCRKVILELIAQSGN
jgi:hypothetical protein